MGRVPTEIDGPEDREPDLIRYPLYIEPTKLQKVPSQTYDLGKKVYHIQEKEKESPLHRPLETIQNQKTDYRQQGTKSTQTPNKNCAFS